VTQRVTFPYVDGARHSPGWYDQIDEVTILHPGDRMFVACSGGPSVSRLEVFPPRLEIAEHGGTYVLDDDGPRDRWQYFFIPHQP